MKSRQEKLKLVTVGNTAESLEKLDRIFAKKLVEKFSSDAAIGGSNNLELEEKFLDASFIKIEPGEEFWKLIDIDEKFIESSRIVQQKDIYKETLRNWEQKDIQEMFAQNLIYLQRYTGCFDNLKYAQSILRDYLEAEFIKNLQSMTPDEIRQAHPLKANFLLQRTPFEKLPELKQKAVQVIMKILPTIHLPSADQTVSYTFDGELNPKFSLYGSDYNALEFSQLIKGESKLFAEEARARAKVAKAQGGKITDKFLKDPENAPLLKYGNKVMTLTNDLYRLGIKSDSLTKINIKNETILDGKNMIPEACWNMRQALTLAIFSTIEEEADDAIYKWIGGDAKWRTDASGNRIQELPKGNIFVLYDAESSKHKELLNKFQAKKLPYKIIKTKLPLPYEDSNAASKNLENCLAKNENVIEDYLPEQAEQNQLLSELFNINDKEEQPDHGFIGEAQ